MEKLKQQENRRIAEFKAKVGITSFMDVRRAYRLLKIHDHSYRLTGKICLTSTGLHRVCGCFGVVLFDVSSSYKEMHQLPWFL